MRPCLCSSCLTSWLVPQVMWWKSGLIPPLGVYPYWTDPFSLFFIEIIAVQFAELKRCGRVTDLCGLSRSALKLHLAMGWSSQRE